MTANAVFGSPLFAVDGRQFLPLLYLAAALTLGAAVIVLVGRWRKGEVRLTPTASDELAQYRELYESGAISEEEYRKLRSILGGEIRKDYDLAPRPVPPPPARGVGTPPPPVPPPTGIRPPE